MTINSDTLEFIAKIIGFILVVWGASRKFTHLEGRVDSVENTLKDEDMLREKIDERLDRRLSSLDSRVQSVETKVVGFEARVDEKLSGLKEGLSDLKKSVADLANNNLAR